MSGQTVTGKALQFTNDNKHAYAFSGFLLFNNTGTTLLEFNTSSEYIVARINCMRSDTDSLDSHHRVFINDIETMNFTLPSGPTVLSLLPKLVFPPHSKIKIDVINVSNSSNGFGGVSVVGKVGMPQRVGNLDE
jgi:hypothetical protein